MTTTLLAEVNWQAGTVGDWFAGLAAVGALVWAVRSFNKQHELDNQTAAINRDAAALQKEIADRDHSEMIRTEAAKVFARPVVTRQGDTAVGLQVELYNGMTSPVTQLIVAVGAAQDARTPTWSARLNLSVPTLAPTSPDGPTTITIAGKPQLGQAHYSLAPWQIEEANQDVRSTIGFAPVDDSEVHVQLTYRDPMDRRWTRDGGDPPVQRS